MMPEIRNYPPIGFELRKAALELACARLKPLSPADIRATLADRTIEIAKEFEAYLEGDVETSPDH